MTPQVPVLEPQPRPSAKAQKQAASHKQRKPVAHRQGLLKSKSLKRTRSVAQGLASNRKADVTNEDVEEVDEGDIGDQTGQVVTEESHTFYIGDIDAFKEFLSLAASRLTLSTSGSSFSDFVESWDMSKIASIDLVPTWEFW